jgi:hypothetical protein
LTEKGGKKKRKKEQKHKEQILSTTKLGSNAITKFIFMEGKKRDDCRLFEIARLRQ